MFYSSGLVVCIMYFLAHRFTVGRKKQESHHIAYDLLSGVFLRLDGSVQLTQHKDTKLLILQQAAHFFHVEPADSLTIQNALHHLLQELLVLTESKQTQ